MSGPEHADTNPLRGLVTDALVWHEISQGRSRLAEHLSAGRASTVLATLALDHAVLPRATIERVICDYVSDHETSGVIDTGLEQLMEVYEAATGWRPLQGEAFL